MLVRKAFELYATGDYTLKAIKQFLADSDLESYKGSVLSVSCAQRMLRNPFYYGNNWLEPMRDVILLSSQAKILLSQGDNQQIRGFLKNVGSNFMLNSKRLEISPKNGWRACLTGKPILSFPNWRRRWESNPRPETLQPGHLHT